MSKENFKVTAKEDGKEYWISRSIAVTVVVKGISSTADEDVFLVHKRGSGCPDNVGKWSANCGYINWGETVKEAGARELYEETGLKIDPDRLEFIGYNDPIDDGKENVTLRFMITFDRSYLEHLLSNEEINLNTKSRGGEENEISEFKLVRALHGEIRNLGDWAFEHDILLRSLI